MEISYENSHYPFVEERIKVCALHLLQGWSPAKVHEVYGEEWDVTLVTVSHYYGEVRKRMKEQILLDEQDIKIDLLSKFQYLYAKFLERDDLEGARKVLDSVAKMAITLRKDITSNGDTIQTIKLIEVKKEE